VGKKVVIAGGVGGGKRVIKGSSRDQQPQSLKGPKVSKADRELGREEQLEKYKKLFCNSYLPAGAEGLKRTGGRGVREKITRSGTSQEVEVVLVVRGINCGRDCCFAHHPPVNESKRKMNLREKVGGNS